MYSSLIYGCIIVEKLLLQVYYTVIQLSLKGFYKILYLKIKWSSHRVKFVAREHAI